MDELIKSNFTIKKPVVLEADPNQRPEEGVAEKLKKAALASIGGSMVYVERTQMTWDGGDESK